MKHFSLYTTPDLQSKGFQLLEESENYTSLSQSQPTWKWSQKWTNLVFLHFNIPYEVLSPLIPNAVSLDTLNGSCFITLVAYTMNNIRHINTPAIPFISDFHQLNIRTYVIKDDKPGIYIFHIEAEKILPVILAKMMSGLSYTKASMKRIQVNDLHYFSSKNKARGFSFEACYKINNQVKEKTELENFLLNRYHLYQKQNENLYRFDINREEWAIQQIQLKSLVHNYKIGNLSLNSQFPILAHYCKGIKALVWERKII